ncbi:MAG TPA: IPT/TIG domain-containing protein [Bryobacteraceae bacterium]|nr:IPT/TIG domain-containing protein [Bryobacteraceae bacterium]
MRLRAALVCVCGLTILTFGNCAIGLAQSTKGTITTFAGVGGLGFSGDGGQAAQAKLFSPNGLAYDKAGNLFIVDAGNKRVRKVSPSGVITTVAGNGSSGFSGDGGPAISASFAWGFNGHLGIAVDKSGNLYIPDYSNQRVRKVDSKGNITTVAGNGTRDNSGDGGAAINAGLVDPIAVAVDSHGNLFIAEFAGNRVRKVDTGGIITTAAGGGPLGSNGDGGLATSAVLNAPFALAFDGAGNLYIGDVTARRVRKVDTSGIITTVAGNGSTSDTGDGGKATEAGFELTGLAADSAGNIFISEMSNRVREVNTSGVINTIAGTGAGGYSGDGGPAVQATISNPGDVAVDNAGNLYIADSLNSRVRMVNGIAQAATGVSITSVVSGASFQPGIVANSWVTLLGANLSGVTDTWSNYIVDGRLPTTVDGVTVTIGGKAAYLYYVSSSQINLVAPDIAPGTVEVVVQNSSGTSQAFSAQCSQYGPAFFSWPGSQVVATRQDYTLAVKDGTFGSPTAPAKPGDVLILWGTGFGPTNPAAPTGVQLPGDQTYWTTKPPSVTIANVSATVYGAALAPGFAGLYQVAIQVPSTLPDGDWPIVASIGGVESPGGTVLSVRQ